MRAALAILLALAGSPAWSAEFNAEKTAHLWYDANLTCRQGENPDGTAATAEQADGACVRRELLTLLLETHNQCWDRSEVEWRECGPDGETPVPMQAN